MRRFVSLCLVCALSVAGGQAADRHAAVAQFQQDYPAVSFYEQGERITRIYGPAFGFGDSPEQVAEEFRLDYAGVFGVDADNLLPVGPAVDWRHTQPVMFDRDILEYRFTLVYYTQHVGGIPVFRADLRLLVRNEADHPLVWVGSSLRDLGAFKLARTPLGMDAGRFQGAVTERMPDLVNFTAPQRVIWAGVGDTVVQAKLAVQFIGDNGKPATPDYEKWLFIADAVTGQILYTEDMILNADVGGNVSGYATDGWGADICGPELLTPMPYARVNIVGGNTAYADENGDFLISHGGDTQVTVQSPLRGRWFRVFNQAGADTVLELDVVPPGPANFEHNAGGAEYTTAEVNSYLHSNVVRDLVIYHNPGYPGLQQAEFPVNVNLNDTCNAYYDYSSINFFRAGGGCANSGFSTVVHHEYGHHLVSMAGSGQGQYGEGMGDVMGVLISDDPHLAWGFFNNCNNWMRNADNNLQYPCNGPIHDCGRLISGCVWSTRTELLASYPDTYLDIISGLAINAMLLHGPGNTIDPSITIDYLTLDDDDGNIGNGTPHWYEICAGFGAHNMDCPPLELIGFEYPDGLPELLTPNQETIVRVNVVSITEDPQPGTGTVTYRVDGGSFQEVAMTQGAPNEYEATLPPVDCESVVDYYFSADTMDNFTVTDPYDAPGTTFSVAAAHGIIVAFEDDFEVDQGWTVITENPDTGAWVRVVPSEGGDRGDPATDFDGSSRCYVTGNSGDEDVDGGPTRLISPQLDLSGGTDYMLRYARWFYNDDNDIDRLLVQISNDDGGSWVTVENVSHAGTIWIVKEFSVADLITPTAQVRVRFSATDNPNDSVTEAAIDAFSVSALDCEPECVGDLNGDGQTGQEDLGILLADWGCTGGNCAGDLDGDGETGQEDLGILLADWNCGGGP